MAKKIIRSAEAWSYIPVSDRTLPAEEQTTFRLTPLSINDRLATNDSLSRTVIEPDGTQVIESRERQTAVRLCLEHIESVENFPVGAPAPWPAKRDERLAYLDQFEDELVRELGNEIYGRSCIGAPEKN